MAHTLKETIDLAVKTAILRAHPIGSYYLTEGNENPADFIGGGWNQLKSLVIQASDDKHAAGTTAEAGLPEIAGAVGGVFVWGEGGTRAFLDSVKENSADFTVNSSMSHQWRTLNFKASNSNVIYGKSDTVQPPARFVNVWKRIS